MLYSVKHGLWCLTVDTGPVQLHIKSLLISCVVITPLFTATVTALDTILGVYKRKNNIRGNAYHDLNHDHCLQQTINRIWNASVMYTILNTCCHDQCMHYGEEVVHFIKYPGTS